MVHSLPELFSGIFELVVDSGHRPTLEVTINGPAVLRLVVVVRIILSEPGLCCVGDLDCILKWLLKSAVAAFSCVFLEHGLKVILLLEHVCILRFKLLRLFQKVVVRFPDAVHSRLHGIIFALHLTDVSMRPPILLILLNILHQASTHADIKLALIRRLRKVVFDSRLFDMDIDQVHPYHLLSGQIHSSSISVCFGSLDQTAMSVVLANGD